MKINILTFVFILTAAGMACAQRVSLQKGEQYQVQTTIQNNMSQNLMGMQMNNSLKIDNYYQVQVIGVYKDSIQFKSTLTRIASLLTGTPAGDMRYDSDDPKTKESPLANGLSNMVGQTSTATILLVNGRAVLPKPKAAKTDMANPVNSAPDQVVYAMFTPMPEPVTLSKGATWQDDTSLDPDAVTKNTYTIREINGSEANIQFTGTTQVNKKVEQMGMEMTTRMSGQINGQAVADITTGLNKTVTVKANMKGNTEAMGQQIPVTVDLSTHTVITKK